MTRRYFEEEMRYLQDAAEVYAEEHPEQAEFLDIDSVSDRDPYVERLFEGFAFLSGRIHKRLDNEMPEYTESLIQLLQPHFLKPIPARSIVEFDVQPGLVQETTVLERGLELRSEPVGPEDVRCRFTTTQDVRLQPFRLDDVSLSYSGGDQSSVRLRFDVDRGVDVGALDVSPLRLYFHADGATASTMHRFFTRHVSHVDVSSVRADGTTALRGQRWVQPGGLSETDALLPYDGHTFAGLRLLQEYFCFRRKFWFVDLMGLDRFNPQDNTSAFTVDVYFDALYPEERRFDAENIRLHCTPVVNLFRTDAEPLQITGEVGEHRVVPSITSPESVETYDVTKVVGVEDASGDRRVYERFFQFDRVQDGHDDDRFFTTSRRIGPTDRPEVYLSLGDAHFRALEQAPSETVSLEVRCTNGTLPRKAIKEGMINQLPPEVPDIARPRNLTQPTRIQYPPNQDESDFFWKLISHWSFNYRTVAEQGTLVGLLELYDWPDTGANQRRREGIREVKWEPKDIVVDGAVRRGAEVTIEVQDGHFADQGDLCLFGLVMSRFLSLYATINSFVHLTIVTTPSEKRYEWTPRRGARPNL